MKSYEELDTMAIMSFMDVHVYVHVSALVIYFIDQMKFFISAINTNQYFCTCKLDQKKCMKFIFVNFDEK